MPEILHMVTIERRLYRPDAIPWSFLLAETNLQRLRERFKFKALGQELGPAGAIARMTGTAGEFSTAGTLQVVEQLVLEPTVLHVQITGGSDVADSFLADLTGVLCEMGNSQNIAQARELTRTYQTVAIAKLRIPFDALLSERVLAYLTEEVKPRVVLPNGQPEIILERLSWSVRYKMDTTDFLYIPKTITIEPRQGSGPTELIYYTVSPTDAKTHLELLEKLESRLAG